MNCTVMPILVEYWGK